MRAARLLAATLGLCAVVAVAPPADLRAATTGCAPNLAGGLSTTGAATQLITVVAAQPPSTTGTLALWTRANGCWRLSAGPWQAWLGRNGVSDHHREGDGTTPEGAYGIGPIMYGVAPDPGVRYAYHPLVCGDWWDEDPSSPAYNTFVHVPCGARPDFGGGSEALWLATTAYAHFALIDYNTHPVVPGAGSAIFLHVSTATPTNGCVALPSSELVAVLRWLRPGLSPLIVIGTTASIRGF